jgi:hypothetical protein
MIPVFAQIGLTHINLSRINTVDASAEGELIVHFDGGQSATFFGEDAGELIAVLEALS